MALQDFLGNVNAYFARLTDYEKYAWLAEVGGLGLLIAGIIFW